jgi:ParB/RepB/Spo0J family partition protein
MRRRKKKDGPQESHQAGTTNGVQSSDGLSAADNPGCEPVEVLGDPIDQPSRPIIEAITPESLEEQAGSHAATRQDDLSAVSDAAPCPVPNSTSDSSFEGLSATDNPRFTREEILVDRIDQPLWPIRDPVDHADSDVEEMAVSITTLGLFNDIIVRAAAGDRYVLIGGLCRLLAVRKAGLSHITARVYAASLTDEDAIRFMWEENERRTPVPVLRKARWLRALMEERGMSQDELSEMLGISQSQLSGYFRVLDGPEEIRRRVDTGDLSFTRALEIIREQDEHDGRPARKASGRPRGTRSAAGPRQPHSGSHRTPNSRNRQGYCIVSNWCVHLPGGDFRVAIIAPHDQKWGFNPGEAIEPAKQLLTRLRKEAGLKDID